LAKGSRKLRVILSREAEANLEEIWHWNAMAHDPQWADDYRAFLISNIRNLAAASGRIVAGEPALRYVRVRKKAKSHGHIIVFREAGEDMEIVFIFHTAQDWQNRLRDK
jgi:plasmid stabilization system protein ParE